MPHILIDYSANLEDRLDLPGLLVALRDAAVATGVFPLAGIRIRARKVDHVLMADGDPAHAYLDIIARIGAGRDPATRTRALDAIFAAAEAFTAPAMATSSLMLSMELREIDATFSRKTSSIRRYLPKDAQ
jgi:5-carboxymethyl-2-hydroxymuconate isomerase